MRQVPVLGQIGGRSLDEVAAQRGEAPRPVTPVPAVVAPPMAKVG